MIPEFTQRKLQLENFYFKFNIQNTVSVEKFKNKTNKSLIPNCLHTSLTFM